MEKLITYKFMFFAFLSILFVILDVIFACYMYRKNKNLEKYTKVANNYYDIYNLFFIGTLINWISSNLTLNILIVMLFIFGMFFVVALIKYEFEANTNQVSKSKRWYSFLKDVLANIMIAFLLGIFANTSFPSTWIIILIILSFAFYIFLLKKSEW